MNRLRPHLLFAPLLLLLLSVSGCKRFEVVPHGDYVYVVAKQTYLRDRVAAVSNKVAVVNNGERLEIVDHGRRFLKVKTGAGATGWLEEHTVIDQADYDKFKALHDAQLNAVAVSTAVLRDDLYAHLLPGRDTPHFLLLPENDRLELLQRASIPKPDAQAAWLKSGTKAAGTTPGKTPTKAPVKPIPRGKHGKVHKESEAARFVDPNAPPMEDWWLVRDGAGRIGWVLARRLDVDVPDEVVQYTEGQRIVGAYLLNKVSDPDSKFPNGLAPNYVAVLSPYKDGLPYDYDQIRVFAWNVKKHRYEGAYRKRDIAGYLPVVVKQQAVETSGPLAGTPVPVFIVKVATDSAVPSLDADTGLVKKVDTEEQSFSLEGEMVKRLLPAGPATAPKATAAPGTAAPAAHVRHRSRAAAPKRHHHR